MSVSVTLDDHGLIDRMGRAPEIVEEEMVRGVTRIAQAGSGKAKQLTGVKSGHGRRSITHTKATFAGGTATASYGTNVPYMRIHDKGRGPVVAKGRALRFTIGGRVLFRKRVGPAKGRHFMKGSRDWLEPQLSAEGRAILQRIRQRVGG